MEKVGLQNKGLFLLRNLGLGEIKDCFSDEETMVDKQIFPSLAARISRAKLNPTNWTCIIFMCCSGELWSKSILALTIPKNLNQRLKSEKKRNFYLLSNTVFFPKCILKNIRVTP